MIAMLSVLARLMRASLTLSVGAAAVSTAALVGYYSLVDEPAGSEWLDEAVVPYLLEHAAARSGKPPQAVETVSLEKQPAAFDADEYRLTSLLEVDAAVESSELAVATTEPAQPNVAHRVETVPISSSTAATPGPPSIAPRAACRPAPQRCEPVRRWRRWR